MMAFEGSRGDSITFDNRQAPIDRQLTHILSGLDPASDLRLTTLIQDLTNPSSTASSSTTNFFNQTSSIQVNRSAEINKLFIRIRQLLQSKKDVQIGLQLVNELIRSSPWQMIVSQCSEWINSALLHFKDSPKEAITILDSLLGYEARQRPEFWRNVGSSASTKYGLILLDASESLLKEKENEYSSTILNALTNQIALHPTAFRSHAPRIQKVCFSLIFQSQRCVSESVRLLARLPLTGKGVEDQKHLWSVTLKLFLREARLAWDACCNAFLPSSSSDSSQSTMFSQNSLDQSDNLAMLKVAHSRLTLLLGSMPNPGILATFLGEPSASAVEVPTEEILGLAHSILSLQPLSPTRLEYSPETTLHAAQAALLPRAHICAITFLATLPPLMWQRGYGETIRRLINVAEKGSPTVRCAALKSLSIMPITFDPHGPLVARCTRTCLAQITKLVSYPSEDHMDSANGSGSTSITTSNNGGHSRANKKRRTYEADQVLFKPLCGLVDLEEDEQEACSAAAKLLSSNLFEYLITFVTPQLHDLAQSTCILLLGVVELALKAESQVGQNQAISRLVESLVSSLANLVSLSRGPMLSILTVRAAPLCAQAIVHPDRKVRLAAESLRIALCDTFHPKLPPKLALRLHVDQDRLNLTMQSGGGGNETMEEKQLDEIVLDEERGKSEIEIMRDVLDIDNDGKEKLVEGDQQQQKSTLIQFPRLSASSSTGLGQNENLLNTLNPVTLSPDPVKPIQRKSIPSIGSPNINVRIGSQSPERVLTTFPSSSSSPTTMKNAEEGSNSPFAAQMKKATTNTQQIDTQINRTTSLVKEVQKESIQKTMVFDEDDSDDSMPALDVRSSDEEDD